MSLRALGLSPTRSPAHDRLTEDRAAALRRKLEDLRQLYTAPWLSDSDRAAIAEEGRRLRERLQEYTGVRRGKGTFSTLC